MRNLKIKNTDSLAPCGREKVYQSNLVNQSEGYLNIYSTPLTPALSRKGRGSQSGRSMIEMLGVLAIIGVLSVGGIAGYSKAMMKYRINKTIEQITLIAGNIRAFWGPQKNYIGVTCYCNSAGCDGLSSGDGCPIVKKAKILPDEMLTTDNTGKITAMTDAFGYSIALDNYYKDGFFLDFGVPEEACIELVSYDWQSAGVKFITTYANGDVSAAVPISVDTATKMCMMDSDEISIIFQFDRKTCDGCIRIDTE